MADAEPNPSSSSRARGLAAFFSRDFRLYQMARTVVIVGAEAQAVAVAWHVYAITHSALALGYTGLALFLPGLFFILPAGHAADRFDRRRVILVCYSLQVLCTAALLALSWLRVEDVRPIYAVLFLIGSGRAFSGPASSVLVPHLVPEEHVVNAITWGTSALQIANITGPAVGGLLFTLPLGRLGSGRLAGAGIVYAFTLLCLFWFLALVARMRVRPGRMEQRAASRDVLLAGFRYVIETRILLGSITLDLFVVLLGGATALLPIFADSILHTGPRGLGLLRSAPALGALVVSLLLTVWPLRRRAGQKMFAMVAVFGAMTILFGLSRSLPLSVAALALLGAADTFSVVIRGSILQLATPPAMRGRVSAVNSLFIGASNELGEFESGLTAHWLGAVRAVLAGGVGSLAVTGIWAALFPSLRRVDRLTASALHAGIEESALAASRAETD